MYICVTATKSRHEYFHPSSQRVLLCHFAIDQLLPLHLVNHWYIFCPFIIVFFRMPHQWSHTTCRFFVSGFFFPLNMMLVRVIHFVACKLLIIFLGFVFPFYAFTNDMHLGFFFFQFLAILNKISSKSPPMHIFWITSGWVFPHVCVHVAFCLQIRQKSPKGL